MNNSNQGSRFQGAGAGRSRPPAPVFSDLLVAREFLHSARDAARRAADWLAEIGGIGGSSVDELDRLALRLSALSSEADRALGSAEEHYDCVICERAYTAPANTTSEDACPECIRESQREGESQLREFIDEGAEGGCE